MSRGGLRTAGAALDHILVGAANLDDAIGWFEERTGVRAVRGGRHEGLGTWNAIATLGARRYVELIAPDPEQPGVDTFYVPGLRSFGAPRLARWAATPPGGRLSALAPSASLDVGSTRNGSRTRPDGSRLRWSVAFPVHEAVDERDIAWPFLIEWGGTDHPGGDGAGCPLSLRTITFAHPAPPALRRAFEDVGISAEIAIGPRSTLSVALETPRGPITLEG